MGHPVLRTKTRPVEKSDLKSAVVQRLIDDMIDTMVEYHGVGLAAPQVHETLRLFVATLDADEPADGQDEPEPEPIAIINPEIAAVGTDLVEDWEGCLSIPDIRGKVPARARDRRACAQSQRRAHRAPGARLFRTGHPARNRSPRRRPVFRSDAIVRDADVPGRVLAILDEGQGLGARAAGRLQRDPRFFSSARSDCRRSSSTSE